MDSLNGRMKMLFYQFVPILFLWICTVILTRSELSPYNKYYCCSKSVAINNKRLAKILIAKKAPIIGGKNCKPEKNKLSIAALTFYCAEILVFFWVIILTILPPKYITPYEIDTRLFYLYIDSINMELAFRSVFLIIPLMLISYSTKAIIFVKRTEKQKKRSLLLLYSILLIISIILFCFSLF